LQPNGEPGASKQQKDQEQTLVDQLRAEWKQLWAQRFNDQVRAEGVSAADYEVLRVQRGTVIHATRDYKPLNFKEILTENQVQNAERHIAPSTTVGGWNKFVKTQITNSPRRKREAPQVVASKKADHNQPKKGGRGWLHKK
jgi:hypothetical protein